MTIQSYINIEQESQIREFAIEYVTNEFEATGGINVKQMIVEICAELKRNYIQFRIGVVSVAVNKLTDKLIWNL